MLDEGSILAEGVSGLIYGKSESLDLCYQRSKSVLQNSLALRFQNINHLIEDPNNAGRPVALLGQPDEAVCLQLPGDRTRQDCSQCSIPRRQRLMQFEVKFEISP